MDPPFQNIALCAIAIWGVGVLIAERTDLAEYVSDRRRRKCGKKLWDSRKALQSLRVHFVRTRCGSRWIAGGGCLGAAGPTLGQDLLLNSLAAIVVGGTSVSGGVGGPTARC